MSSNDWNGPESSGWWFGLFVAVIVGLLAVMFAGQLGDAGVRSLLLAVMLGLFVLGGSLLGLLVSHHLCQTHLSETQLEEHLAQKPVHPVSASVEQSITRQRGYLGLFGSEQEEASPRTDSGRRVA